MVATAFSQLRFTVTKHCGNKSERSCLRRSRPSVAHFKGDRRQATEKATLPLLEGPSEPTTAYCDFTHAGYDNNDRLIDELLDTGNKAQQQYLRARFYNPANGKFNRLDPL